MHKHASDIAKGTGRRRLRMREADWALSDNGPIDMQVIHQQSVAEEVVAHSFFSRVRQAIEGALSLAATLCPVDGHADLGIRLCAQNELTQTI